LQLGKAFRAHQALLLCHPSVFLKDWGKDNGVVVLPAVGPLQRVVLEEGDKSFTGEEPAFLIFFLLSTPFSFYSYYFRVFFFFLVPP
jgi:hypothetical protein